MRSLSFVAIAAVVLVGLGAGSPSAAPRARSGEAIAEAPATPKSPKPAEAPKGERCGAQTCTPPERCIDVVGMRPESARKECWITCGGTDTCPTGMKCTMIHDGPGKVCVKN